MLCNEEGDNCEEIDAGNTLSSTIDNLNCNTAYTFRVRAYTSVGDGPYSESITASPSYLTESM